MIEVKKRDGESPEGMLKRFSRKVQQSGIVLRARSMRYYKRRKSETLKRRSALRRLAAQQEREENRRLGIGPIRPIYGRRR